MGRQQAVQGPEIVHRGHGAGAGQKDQSRPLGAVPLTVDVNVPAVHLYQLAGWNEALFLRLEGYMMAGRRNDKHPGQEACRLQNVLLQLVHCISSSRKLALIRKVEQPLGFIRFSSL